MIFAFLLLATGLTISAVAIYYSVIGLTAIFAAAFWPVVIMGVTLEAAKLVAASWLKSEWKRIPRLLKTYLTLAVIILMIITSMGIFGFLSKAHLDQNLVSGDVVDKVAIIDEKIKTQRDNIEAARKALRQMDEAVDQTMSRSTSEQGADKAATLRRQQQRERTNLQNDIAKSQTEIGRLNEQRAPIAKELRAVEAEVGPIKYIAKLIYGDNPDANILEKSVTWVIIMIVIVFDPLAILLLISAQMAYMWAKMKKDEELTTSAANQNLEVNTHEANESIVNSNDVTVEEQRLAQEANDKLSEIEKEFDIDATMESINEIKVENTPAVDYKVLDEVDKERAIELADQALNWVKDQTAATQGDRLPETEQSKKKTYIIKEQGQQIKKTKQ